MAASIISPANTPAPPFAATLAPYLHAIVAEVERQIAMVVSCGRTDALHHG
jgi:hypothetical protein